MAISETMAKFIAKMFGKKERTHGDYHRCERWGCWKRYKFVQQPKAISEIDQAVGYDRSRFCSALCAVPAVHTAALWGPTKRDGKPVAQHVPRQARRRELLLDARASLLQRFGGEPRKNRRLMASRLAKNTYRQERERALA